MPLFFSPYIGAGTLANPFRPTSFDIPGASAIDLRADKGVTLDGGGFKFALLWLPAGSPEASALVKLADFSGDTLTQPMRDRLALRTGLDFSADATIKDAVETLLISPPKNAWNPLRPAAGRLEAWLGSEAGRIRWIDAPVLAGGALTDNFNRANETPIAAPWTELAGSTGDINLATNAVTKVTSGDYFAYYANGAGWNADQTSEWKYATAVTNDDWGPAVRVGSNGFSGYFYSQFSGGRSLGKFVAGSFTNIEAASGATATGVPYKVSAVGSTIRYYDNGVENANSPATDTSLATAGNGVGVFWYEAGGSLDDWTGTGEVAAGGGAFPFPAQHPMAHMLVR